MRTQTQKQLGLAKGLYLGHRWENMGANLARQGVEMGISRQVGRWVMSRQVGGQVGRQDGQVCRQTGWLAGWNACKKSMPGLLVTGLMI